MPAKAAFFRSACCRAVVAGILVNAASAIAHAAVTWTSTTEALPGNRNLRLPRRSVIIWLPM